MKRFATSLIASLLAFTAGLVTASSWTTKSNEATAEQFAVNVAEPCPPPSQSGVTVNSAVTVPREFAFAEGRLKVVPEHVQLKSESHRYDIDVSYPQIVGIQTPQIRKVNQYLKDEATKLYQPELHPAELNLLAAASTYHTVNFTYDVNLATDSLLSVRFIGYSYGPDSNYSTQRGVALNYDLTSGKSLKLTDIFKPESKYLEFISSHSIDELSRWSGSALIEKALAPVAKNFENFWHITSNGIVFNFPACTVRSCTDGVQTVDIDFSELEPLLKAGIPGKFEITYP